MRNLFSIINMNTYANDIELLKRIDFTGKRAKDLLAQYKTENNTLQQAVSQPIYNCIFQQNVTHLTLTRTT